MYKDKTFWLILLIIITGAVLIIWWLVLDMKIGVVGIMPFVTGIIALVQFLRRKKRGKAS